MILMLALLAGASAECQLESVETVVNLQPEAVRAGPALLPMLPGEAVDRRVERQSDRISSDDLQQRAVHQAAEEDIHRRGPLIEERLDDHLGGL